MMPEQIFLTTLTKKKMAVGLKWMSKMGLKSSSTLLLLHFLGNPKEEQASAKTILINLRCPTLTDYMWCKDVFLINVLKREDGTQDFWIERFIAGLPKLFGERILNKLRQNF